jgi:hypothetical protein
MGKRRGLNEVHPDQGVNRAREAFDALSRAATLTIQRSRRAIRKLKDPLRLTPPFPDTVSEK